MRELTEIEKTIMDNMLARKYDKDDIIGIMISGKQENKFKDILEWLIQNPKLPAEQLIEDILI